MSKGFCCVQDIYEKTFALVEPYLIMLNYVDSFCKSPDLLTVNFVTDNSDLTLDEEMLSAIRDSVSNRNVHCSDDISDDSNQDYMMYR